MYIYTHIYVYIYTVPIDIQKYIHYVRTRILYAMWAIKFEKVPLSSQSIRMHAGVCERQPHQAFCIFASGRTCTALFILLEHAPHVLSCQNTKLYSEQINVWTCYVHLQYKLSNVTCREANT